MSDTDTHIVLSRRAVLGGLVAAAATSLLPERAARADRDDREDHERPDPNLTPGVFTPRQFHASVRLGGGHTLVAGGQNTDGFALSDVVLVTASGTVYPLAPLTLARYSHAAVALPDGQVLVLGGLSADGLAAGPLADVEIYDPDRNVWRPAPPLQLARYNHTAAHTTGNRVLIIGGCSTSAVYDPETYYV